MASIVTRWAANERFSYGYVRAEILAGFANGIFLVFIAFYIFTEAVERLFEPPEVKHERLFIISVLGLLVNFVGIFVFQHGGAHHGHSHGDAGHGHSHSGHGHSHSGPAATAAHHHPHSHGNALLNNVPSTASFVTENHSHMNGGHGHESHGIGQESHGHGHGHGTSGSHSQIMQGVFLHILADTLGSVGVIISALLMSNFGWMIADPICSLFIASLVALSVYPLLRDSISVIMQRTPKPLEDQLPACYHRINSLEGVHSIHEPHFWTLCTDQYVGTIGVEIARSADYTYIQNTVRSIFAQIGVKQVYIEIHYANS